MLRLIEKMDRCPVCRARLAESSVCNRCGTELAPLFSILAESQRLFVQSVSAATAGDWNTALVWSQQAEALRATPLSTQWRRYLLARNEGAFCLDERWEGDET